MSKKRISKTSRRVHKPRITSRRRNKRRSKKHNQIHSFGLNISDNGRLKKAVIIAILIAARAMAKGKQSINEDIENLEYGALSILALGSLLEILSKLVGHEITNYIAIGYLILSLGIDMSKLI
jgi:hypothetical protein